VRSGEVRRLALGGGNPVRCLFSSTGRAATD
jgi:hypothetical protein